ncbi:MAG: membrane protein insertion efficiency factor YidD [Limisphaerales bacterium]
MIFSIRLYRWTLSPAKNFLFGPLGKCRFEPSCSRYGMEAIKIHGALDGSWLAFRRICRCQPWGGSGFDPVPLKEFKIQNSNHKVFRRSNDKNFSHGS